MMKEQRKMILVISISFCWAIVVHRVPIMRPSGIRWDNKKKMAKALDLGLWSFKLNIKWSWSWLWWRPSVDLEAKKYLRPKEIMRPQRITVAIIKPVSALAPTGLLIIILSKCSSKWNLDSPINRTVAIIKKKPEEKAYKYLFAFLLIFGFKIGNTNP